MELRRPIFLERLVKGAELLGQEVAVDLEAAPELTQCSAPVLVEILEESAAVGCGQPPVALRVRKLQVALLDKAIELLGDAHAPLRHVTGGLGAQKRAEEADDELLGAGAVRWVVHGVPGLDRHPEPPPDAKLDALVVLGPVAFPGRQE